MCGMRTGGRALSHPSVRRMAPPAPDRHPVASAAARGSGAGRRSTSPSHRHQEAAAVLRRHAAVSLQHGPVPVEVVPCIKPLYAKADGR